MLVDHMRHKRRRSPSPGYDQHIPEAELPSPLDVLVKRRRRGQPAEIEAGDIPGYFQYDPQEGESSSTPYVERRRAKQWDRLNAPRPSLPDQVRSQPHLEFTPPHPTTMSRSYSQPFSNTLHSSPPHAHSQPVPAQHHMSSSPIRHQPFGSSPFKSQSSNLVTPPVGWESSDHSTRVEGQPVYQVTEEEEDEMDPDEMRRSWGVHAEQNELLHSVHRHRAQARQQATPDTSILHTPLPYRDSYFASSPYHPPSSTRSRRSFDSTTMDTDDTMSGAQINEHDQHALTQYEQANRLLAELELVRRRRWGG